MHEFDRGMQNANFSSVTPHNFIDSDAPNRLPGFFTALSQGRQGGLEIVIAGALALPVIALRGLKDAVFGRK